MKEVFMVNKTHIVQARQAEIPESGARPLKKNARLPFTRHIFIDRKSLPEAKVYIALHHVTKSLGAVRDYQVPHYHDVDEFYFFIGDEPDMGGLEGRIKFEGKSHKIASPATVYIPAGLVHQYKVSKGKGKVVILYRGAEYGHVPAEPDLERGEKEADRFKKLIVIPDIRPSSEIRYHHDTAPGKRHVFVGNNMLPEAGIYAIVRNVLDVKTTQPRYVDLHAHNCPSYFLFIGNRPNLSGLKAKVVIGGKETLVESPAAAFVPSGIKHYPQIVGGSGKFFSIVPKGKYDESLI
ncbi:MAG: hypothetical protein Q7T16_00685 [Candidatus Burarchaeum sp.]|nr:hypothetical protein [Candidatus Burarchaeum sp.]MDO8339153.1 hypothetical protein [Candidatus Burarchaeum sp.]